MGHNFFFSNNAVFLAVENDFGLANICTCKFLFFRLKTTVHSVCLFAYPSNNILALIRSISCEFISIKMIQASARENRLRCLPIKKAV